MLVGERMEEENKPAPPTLSPLDWAMQSDDSSFHDETELLHLCDMSADNFRQKTMMCPICYEEKPLSEMFQLSCRHRVMKDCLKEYFVSLMDNNGVDKIKCPHEKCNVQLHDEEMALILDADYPRYLMLSRNKRVAQSNGTLIFCPKSECPGTVAKLRTYFHFNRIAL